MQLKESMTRMYECYDVAFEPAGGKEGPAEVVNINEAKRINRNEGGNTKASGVKLYTVDELL